MRVGGFAGLWKQISGQGHNENEDLQGTRLPRWIASFLTNHGVPESNLRVRLWKGELVEWSHLLCSISQDIRGCVGTVSFRSVKSSRLPLHCIFNLNLTCFKIFHNSTPW